MAEIQWIKLYTSMFDNDKIKLIRKMPEADAILLTWVQLLIQAGKANASGYIVLSESIPFTDEMLAEVFDRPVGIIRMALNVFQQFGMIEVDDRIIMISNWESYQNIDAMERVREKDRLRKQKKREEQKLLSPGNVRGQSVEVPDIELELELELDIDKEKDIKNIDPPAPADPGEDPPKRTSKPKDPKHSYAEFVYLTKNEYAKLIQEHGQKSTDRMIEILSHYKGSKGKTYKSDYHAIKNWVVKRVLEEDRKHGAHRKADSEDLYEGRDFGF